MKVEKVQNYKILIVEDDRGLAQGIAMALLRRAGMMRASCPDWNQNGKGT